MISMAFAGSGDAAYPLLFTCVGQILYFEWHWLAWVRREI